MKKAILSTEIDLRLRPSYLLWGWWCLFSMLVMACLWWKLAFVWALSATAVYGLASGWHWTQLAATSWKHSIQRLRVDVYGQMTVVNRTGQVYQVSVLPDSVVHPWCLVLHMQLQLLHEAAAEPIMRTQRMLLLPDQADRASLTALRVWLRWGQA
ncbi:hypothetical protein [Methylophilus sp. 13]|uniref:hypothetical protein n=1 Tax=Methylophilus sp. 13 TaxID=2781018 RepID=UPI001E2CD568|nr:hypothetical protein [Methylophilus sp. 13]